MGIFDKLKAMIQVGSEEFVDQAGLQQYMSKVDLSVTQSNLQEVKQNLVSFKTEKRTCEKQLSDLNDEISKFEEELQKRVSFVKNELNSEAERTLVKEDAQKLFNRIEEKKKSKETLVDRINSYDELITKFDVEIEHFEQSINKAKDNASELIARQKMADSKIKLANSAEKLIKNHGDLSSKLKEDTHKKESEAEVRFEELFNKNIQDKNEAQVSDILNRQKTNSEFERLFDKD